MRESILRHLQICKYCGHAFQPGIDGDDVQCDACADSRPKEDLDDDEDKS